MSLSLTLAADPVGHVINHKWFVSESGWWLWSSSQTNLVLSGIIVVVLGMLVAKAVQTGPEGDGHARWITRNPLAHMIEVICGYLRENTVRPLLGKRTDRFMPFLWTLFFFILINNMLGLIPLLDAWQLANPDHKKAHMSFIGGTATQSIYVTAVLAMVSGFVINLAGVKELGIGGYIKHLTADAPIFVWPIIIPIEILGTFIKPIALAIRLFANMTAGHILVAVLLGFAATGFAKADLLGIPIGIVSTIAVVAIYFLEIFVGFLQAFVFMFLTTVFISLLEHHHGHDDDHAHDSDHASHGVAHA
ncbi:MAG: F0F1 ATP synthase subunit A [Phycisphaerales bacterium]